jgi:hypothetical protein
MRLVSTVTSWRWTPFFSLLAGSLFFVMLVVLVVPNTLSVWTVSSAQAASSLGGLGDDLAGAMDAQKAAVAARRSRLPPSAALRAAGPQLGLPAAVPLPVVPNPAQPTSLPPSMPEAPPLPPPPPVAVTPPPVPVQAVDAGPPPPLQVQPAPPPQAAPPPQDASASTPAPPPAADKSSGADSGPPEAGPPQ